VSPDDLKRVLHRVAVLREYSEVFRIIGVSREKSTSTTTMGLRDRATTSERKVLPKPESREEGQFLSSP